MSALPSYFTDFLSEIRPTEDQRTAYQAAHKTLRDRLAEDEDTKNMLITTFLQGSYRRATAVRPEGKHRPDVDVIVVTNIDSDDPRNTPDAAVKLLTESRLLALEVPLFDLAVDAEISGCAERRLSD